MSNKHHKTNYYCKWKPFSPLVEPSHGSLKCVLDFKLTVYIG